VGYLPASDTFTAALDDLEDKLARLPGFGLSAPTDITLKYAEEADWANEWKKYFKPVEIGSRLVIKPSWESYDADPSRVVVEIDPGQAFGTGGHPTTRLCLSALERYVRPGMVVADIGTGSGILSIAAARLGASLVHATDIDSLPRTVSRENVARNSLDETVKIHEMDDFDRLARDCDLVVANIIAMTVIELIPSIRERLKPGGLFIASGIVDDRLDDVLATLAANGFELLESLSEEIWRATISQAVPA
jgi:ribosomal protein L11 methyltransferase